jgi:hypothetical protein
MTRRVDPRLRFAGSVFAGGARSQGGLTGTHGGRGTIWQPRDKDKKRAAVTQASTNVAEADGMVNSCTAAVGDAFMGLITRGLIARVKVTVVPMKDSYPVVR